MLELDSRSIMNLMKESNHKQKNVISAISTHENELVKLHANLELNSKHIISMKDTAIKVLTALPTTAKVMETLVHTNAVLNHAENIITQSDVNQLSRHAITIDQLSGLIDSIYLNCKNREDAPYLVENSAEFITIYLWHIHGLLRASMR